MYEDESPKFCTVCGKPVLPGQPCSHGPSFSPNPEPAAKKTRTRRTIMEILLDPKSIQWMLISGGGLLVTGLVVWLASLGFFDNPRVVAGALGAGTMLLLGGGWWMIRGTDYQLAGKAITLLACLIMPLNLWFYHSHHLMTLDGNLWIAAAVCCALYAASATILKDRHFVYVLMAGLAGTGMLILTDMQRFTEIAAPSVMLVVMGLLGIHVERLFPTAESPFSRDKFGMAFFRSGHALLAGGLMLLLGAQLTGWFLIPGGVNLSIPTPEIVIDPALKRLAIGLVLTAFYAYVYSGLVPRRGNRYIAPAMSTLIWAELLGLQMLNITYHAETILCVAAFTGLILIAAGRFVTAFRQVGSSIGNGIVLLSFIGGTMLVISRTLVGNSMWASVVLTGSLGLISLIGAAFAQPYSNWRRGHLLMCLVDAALTATVMVTLSRLTGWQKLEIACVLTGLTMLGFGHIGWYREQFNRSELVSFNLLIGALLAGLPLLIASISHRFDAGLSLPDEMGLLTVSALMLMSGLVCQLRATTITGGTLLSLHIAMLLGFAGWQAQLALGVYLSVGGAAIFLTGLGLAIHRDRLLALPDRIHRREGLFKVLAWR